MQGRWPIFGLLVFTQLAVLTVPEMAMIVLLKEASADLGLSLVQAGFIVGASPLAGAVSLVVAGMMSDRIGIRGLLAGACVLGGVAAASRGLAGGFASLATSSFCLGLFTSMVPVASRKILVSLFSGRELGRANGAVVGAGGVGMALGALLSASLLSPALGGWRAVLLLYGCVSILVGVAWAVALRGSRWSHSARVVPLLRRSHAPNLLEVVRLRAVWGVGLTLFFYMACVKGVSGYLPIYLRDTGWAPGKADAALAVFNVSGVLAVMALTTVSDRIGVRRPVVAMTVILTSLSVGFMSVARGEFVWLLALGAGVGSFGAFALLITMTSEAREVGPISIGTATGVILATSRLGGFVGPPLGNSAAEVAPQLPMVVWAVVCLFGLVALLACPETGWRVRPDPQPAGQSQSRALAEVRSP